MYGITINAGILNYIPAETLTLLYPPKVIIEKVIVFNPPKQQQIYEFKQYILYIQLFILYVFKLKM